MKVFIITGTSQGLGAAIAMQLLAPDHYVICLSRRSNGQLVDRAVELKARLSERICNLESIHQLDLILAEELSEIDWSTVEAIYMVNNAGRIDPISPAGNHPSRSIEKHMQLNILAPMVLVDTLIRLTKKYEIDKRVMNISSGAGRNPMEGWSVYCSSKAALDQYTRCVDLEQKDLPYGVRMMSIAPGVIDTNMQQQIRMSDPHDFKNLPKFLNLHEDGLLQTAEDTAKQLIAVLCGPTFNQQGPIADIRTISMD